MKRQFVLNFSSPENDAPLPLNLLLAEGAVGQDVREDLHGALHVLASKQLLGADQGLAQAVHVTRPWGAPPPRWRG